MSSFRTRGFTLVELLTVCSIITVLIAMLLPSLSGARQRAQSVVCASRLRNLGVAMSNYSAVSQGWLAGAPGTTGLAYWTLAQRSDAPDPRETNLDGNITQDWDWAGPLARHGLGIDLPANRAQRVARLHRNEFHCPSNAYESAPHYGIGSNARLVNSGPWSEYSDWQVLPMSSYSTFVGFMYFGKQPQDQSAESGIYYPHQPFAHTYTPQSYAPRMERVSRASDKALLADGARVIWSYGAGGSGGGSMGVFGNPGGSVAGHRSALAQPEYPVEYAAWHGGAFSDPSPVKNGSRSYFPETKQALHHYAYRHRSAGASAIESLFFDGHVDALTAEQTFRRPDYWFPSGTFIGREAALRNVTKDYLTTEGRWESSPEYVSNSDEGVLVQ